MVSFNAFNQVRLSKRAFFVLWMFIALLMVIVIRFTSLTHELLNSDESSFILTGADLLKGNLPYIHTLDNKPPVIYATFAFAMLVLGKSVIAVRIFGDICVLLTTFFVFLINRKLFGQVIAALTSLFFVAMTGVRFAQHTSSEIVAITYLMASVWLLINFRVNKASLFTSGFFMALAVLVRTNLAFTALAGVLFLIFRYLSNKSKAQLVDILAYCAGGALPLLIIFIIYAMNGHLKYLALGLVKIPMSYSKSASSILDLLLAHFDFWLLYLSKLPLIVVPVTVFAILALLLAIGKRLSRSRRLNENSGSSTDYVDKNAMIILFTFFCTNSLSILLSGGAYAHYQIQIFPFMVIFFGFGLYNVGNKYVITSSLIVLTALLCSTLLYVPQTIDNIRHFQQIESNYPGRKIAQVIQTTIQPDDQVWALRQHVVLLYLNRNPIIPLMTHPSNLTKQSYLEVLVHTDPSMKDPVAKIFAMKPRYIITTKDPDDGPFTIDQNKRVYDFVVENYNQIYSIDELMVYIRK